MKQLNVLQSSRLQKILMKFPQLRRMVSGFNQAEVKWGIAAGTALYIYAGGEEEKLDDVDIWVAREDKGKAATLLGRTWLSRSSERHKAENIELGPIDIFTHCRKFKGKKQLLDYCWTGLVTQSLRRTQLDGVEYRVVSPEDIVLLKMPNPRGEQEMGDIKKLVGLGLDRNYLKQRLGECGASFHLEDKL